MRMSTALLAVVAILLVTACTPSQQRPATVRNYGPEAAGPGTYVQGPSPGVRPAPAQPSWPGTSAGNFSWHYRIADAQAEARASGKLILVLSTKPRCGLCEKFKTQIVPQVAGQCQSMAVGYIYDITPPIRDPAISAVDRTLRANLRGADLMPLVGFLTPELRWVHGFYGARSVAQFQGDMAAAKRIYPVASAGLNARVGGPRMATVVNEYGEPEWSAPGDVWPVEEPEPIDAITGYPEIGDPSARRLADRGPPVDAPAVPDVPAAALPAVDPQPIAEVSPVEPPAPYVGIQTPVAEPSKPAATAATWSPAAAGGDDWGEEALDRALADIRSGRFDAARTTLDEIQSRLPSSTYAREAAKGCIALYNAKRIRGAASGSERNRYLSRARRDLGSSRWGVLFGA